MLLNRILELDDLESILLAEESWQDLLDLPVTDQILKDGLDADDVIEIKGLGYALHLQDPAPIWLVITDRYSGRKISPQEAEGWQSLIKRRVETGEEEFLLAINECLSLSLAGELFCQSCLPQAELHYVEERIERLEHLLLPLLPEEGSLLEICCGSGVATQALLRLGHRPISMDSDRCEVCQGLKAGGLEPEKSMVLDARQLSSIFPPRSFRAVLGFMVGLIEDFNWPAWREILLRSAALAEERAIFTVYTQKEAELIARALQGEGWKAEVIDNRDSKGIYDQWACLALRP
ncbi:MAG TPA: hypothetical protein PLK88_07060 [Methanothrix sp.]|nr:hypothetical protein [Methanothrix sp.]HQJ80317.1 hypothetical protein [Methanothrix sp.]HUM80369.1 hypothetical protein [Methanothrix sp.]